MSSALYKISVVHLYDCIDLHFGWALKQITMSMDNMKSIEPLASELTPVMTDYDRMCKESNNVPKLHNMLASFFTWILLAGFIVFPGTFTSLRRATSSTTEARIAGQVVRVAVQNTPLIAIAAVCCFVGTYGMYRLWRVWKKNYEWLLIHIFLCVFCFPRHIGVTN
jgi:hypothetical protein